MCGVWAARSALKREFGIRVLTATHAGTQPASSPAASGDLASDRPGRQDHEQDRHAGEEEQVDLDDG